MAGEIQTDQPSLTGTTLYALVFNASGLVWNGTTFATPVAGSWATYAVALTEITGTGLFRGDFPAAPAGTYFVSARRRVGGSPAASDPIVALGRLDWSGSGLASAVAARLAADGLDPITVEAGINARQALAGSLSAAAGVVSGAGTGTVILRAAGAPGTTRIQATTDANGNRSAITLSLPS